MLKSSADLRSKRMTTNPAIHIVKPQLSSQHPAERQRLIGQPRFHFDPQQVMQLLKQRIIGQDAALAEIEKMLNVVKADFSSPERLFPATGRKTDISMKNAGFHIVFWNKSSLRYCFFISEVRFPDVLTLRKRHFLDELIRVSEKMQHPFNHVRH